MRPSQLDRFRHALSVTDHPLCTFPIADSLLPPVDGSPQIQ